MPAFELKVKDIANGELEVKFNAESIGKVGDMVTNTAAQNLAIMIIQEMAKVGINLPRSIMD